MFQESPELGQFLLALVHLFAKDAELRFQVRPAGVVQLAFVDCHLPRLGHEFGREFERTAFGLGGKAGDLAHQAVVRRLLFAEAGGEAGVVDAKEDLAGLDHLPFPDQDLFQDSAFQVLDHLHLR